MNKRGNQQMLKGINKSLLLNEHRVHREVEGRIAGSLKV